MRRFLLAGGIVLGIAGCYLTLRWISWLTGPRPQYPAYPRVQWVTMHPAVQGAGQTLPARLEFQTRDSAAQVRAFYTANLRDERWTLARDAPDRLVFERFWTSVEQREEITVALDISASLITGTVSYRAEPFYPCGPPALC
ncbi:MAG TPA: hypothetical protein VD886_16410 [Herpetosiphonaceae bacterium]|nr:hypothetical protein [Herpetosiphonaceae bacterium]